MLGISNPATRELCVDLTCTGSSATAELRRALYEEARADVLFRAAVAAYRRAGPERRDYWWGVLKTCRFRLDWRCARRSKLEADVPDRDAVRCAYHEQLDPLVAVHERATWLASFAIDQDKDYADCSDGSL